MDVFGFNTADSDGMDGFFGSVSSGLGNAWDSFSSDILPNWAANQLGMQSTDQLAVPTYNAPAPAPIIGQAVAPPTVQNAFLDTTNQSKYQISPSTILMIGAVAIMALVVLKKV